MHSLMALSNKALKSRDFDVCLLQNDAKQYCDATKLPCAHCKVVRHSTGKREVMGSNPHHGSKALGQSTQSPALVLHFIA